MIDFFERWRLKRVFYSKIFLVLLAILVSYLGWIVFGTYQRAQEVRTLRTEKTQKLSELQSRETALVVEIERLRTSRGVEEEIRSKYDVAKEGEGVVIIIDAPEKEVNVEEERKGFFGKVLDLIF